MLQSIKTRIVMSTVTSQLTPAARKNARWKIPQLAPIHSNSTALPIKLWLTHERSQRCRLLAAIPAVLSPATEIKDTPGFHSMSWSSQLFFFWKSFLNVTRCFNHLTINYGMSAKNCQPMRGKSLLRLRKKKNQVKSTHRWASSNQVFTSICFLRAQVLSVSMLSPPTWALTDYTREIERTSRELCQNQSHRYLAAKWVLQLSAHIIKQPDQNWPNVLSH